MDGEIDVSMLWEAVDARSALAARFGFDDAHHVASSIGQALKDAWAADLDHCDRVVMSDSNVLAWLTVDGRGLIAKCCIDATRFSRLAAVDALVSWLGDRDFPVAAPIATMDGRLRVEHGRFSIGLYPLINGNLLDATDKAQVKSAGRTLAALHQVLSTYPRRLDGDGPAQPDSQLVHGDFRSANVLTDGARITAVLDFEDAISSSRIADLGRSAVLLATRYHDWAPTDRETRRTFITAYDDVAPLNGAEYDELTRTIEAVCNHFGWT